MVGHDRPELAKALAACRRHRAQLIVAKLDRLSRDARFLLNLKAEGVKFVVADMPEANDLTVDLFAILAAHERRVISERTKAALAAAKRRGVALGGHPERISRAAARRGSRASAALRSDRADQMARDFAPRLEELRAAGVTSLRAIARALNEDSTPAPRGGEWSATQVARLLSRIRNRRQSALNEGPKSVDSQGKFVFDPPPSQVPPPARSPGRYRACETPTPPRGPITRK